MFDEGDPTQLKEEPLSYSLRGTSNTVIFLLCLLANNSHLTIRMRRACNTWDDGRKKTRQTTAENHDPTLKSACSNGQLTRRDNTDRSALKFLAAEAPPPKQLGRAGGFKKQVPTALRQGRTLDNHAADAQQRPTRESIASSLF